MRILKATVLALCCMTSPVAATANTDEVHYQALDRPFLELLGFIEGPDGYNEVTGFATRQPIKPVTSMTINEVLDFQRMLRQQGAKSSAMGRYQYVYKTLLYLTDTHNIDRNRLFDASMQDHLTRLEMSRCGFYDQDTTVSELGDCLAHVWAALPLLTGENRGKSRYRNTGINFVQTSPIVVEAILNNRFIPYQVQTYTRVRATRAGFNMSASHFPGYHAPQSAQPVEAVAAPQVPPTTTSAPTVSLRPQSRNQ